MTNPSNKNGQHSVNSMEQEKCMPKIGSVTLIEDERISLSISTENNKKGSNNNQKRKHKLIEAKKVGE